MCVCILCAYVCFVCARVCARAGAYLSIVFPLFCFFARFLGNMFVFLFAYL